MPNRLQVEEPQEDQTWSLPGCWDGKAGVQKDLDTWGVVTKGWGHRSRTAVSVREPGHRQLQMEGGVAGG